ncbi:ABC transporter permease [Lederbergia panacisoli]|uniref:ABC transporter permease n=1 Tax=Lederbergia panacisoli TaxID=1255251 RepID=UPI00214C92E1|nr:ABC transporter permease [Lederbergia panacisoli]MCR2823028.1 ABC transporter permease [Lederbergia panacisoli]
MAIIKLIFRKMLNNRWLTGSLFLGLIITVSLVSSIPTYTSSVLQKLLVRELEDHQVKKNQYPGEFSFSDTFANSIVKKPAESLAKVEDIKKNIVESAGIPVVADVNLIATTPLRTMFEEEERRGQSQNAAKLLMITSFEEHIKITDGTYPSDKAVDGVVEALVSETALVKRSMVLGTTFVVGSEKDHQFIIKPVGTFQPKSVENPFWSLIPQSFNDDFIVNEKWFRSELIQKHEEILGIGRFSSAFDYHKIEDSHFPMLLRMESKLKSEVSSVKKATILFNFPIKNILKSYDNKGKQMTTMLWSLNVPVLIMLAIYLYMISRLIIERQLNEIAVFTSRGASRFQILGIYFIEIAILGAIALLIGPLIGLQLCKLLGASNGFLEFIQRSALPVKLSMKSYTYALVAVLASIIMIMIPVYRASGQSIVNHKQQSARDVGKVPWYTVIFELAVLGISIYGLMAFNRSQKVLQSIDVESSDIMIDPELFFMPALFIIGLGLVALRIYPLILKLIYKIGEKFWPVSLYSTFLQVSRSTKQYQFLMLFLVMTIGMGVFSASAARTINTNLEEQLLYKNGSEIRMLLRWESSRPLNSGYTPPSPSGPEGGGGSDAAIEEIEPIVYTEPPFDPIQKLEQVDKAAKVFKKDSVSVTTPSGKSIHYPTLMAVEPKAFGETAWFKPSLLPHHWFQYLNLIANEPSAVLVSKKAAEALDLKQGDYISMQWAGSDYAEFVVYGIIDYWPSFNPLEKLDENRSEGALIVANLPFVQNMLGLEPYEVWLKLKPDTPRAEFYQAIKDAKIPVTVMNDVNPQITDLKNGALLLGLNGTMTLGFLISLLISFIGFLLYWVLTIKSRTLQYGIYRAMGIPMPKLIGILVSEQVLTSGFACILGIIVGGVTSQLFVPLFKLSMNVRDLMPPFTVISDASDEAKIYIFSALMLILGSAILIGFLRKIKIHQAIKLGED